MYVKFMIVLLAMNFLLKKNSNNNNDNQKLFKIKK